MKHMNMYDKETRADIEFCATLKQQIRLERDAINGTLTDLQRYITDSKVLDRVETLIKHSRELGRLETALKRKVAV